MFLETEDNLPRSEDLTKIVYIYENSCNNKQPVQYRIKNQKMVFKDIARILKFKKLRLFNEQGAQYFEDDIQFVKNKTSLYASKGEDFDPHNCFGQYEIIKKLGQGGFGEVFLANHRHTGEKCAIKIIKISSATDIDSIFVEAEILKSLKHQNIVKVTNCLTLKNMQVAIIMEFLEGGELLNYVQKQKRISQATCKIFLRQIVKGIMYCHDNFLIHRDLKLENILLVNSEEKKIKIIDFGIAGMMSRLTEEDLDTGSLGYMAPECFVTSPQNFKFDGSMDVWAIGVILYSMLCGQLPFKGSNTYEIKQNIRKAQYKLPIQIKKSITKDCLNVIFRCLDPNPKTRIKIGQLMNHQWFSKNGQSLQEPSNKKIVLPIPQQKEQHQPIEEVTKKSKPEQKKEKIIKQTVKIHPPKVEKQNQKEKKAQPQNNKSTKGQSKEKQERKTVGKSGLSRLHQNK